MAKVKVRRVSLYRLFTLIVGVGICAILLIAFVNYTSFDQEDPALSLHVKVSREEVSLASVRSQIVKFYHHKGKYNHGKKSNRDAVSREGMRFDSEREQRKFDQLDRFFRANSEELERDDQQEKEKDFAESLLLPTRTPPPTLIDQEQEPIRPPPPFPMQTESEVLEKLFSNPSLLLDYTTLCVSREGREKLAGDDYCDCVGVAGGLEELYQASSACSLFSVLDAAVAEKEHKRTFRCERDPSTVIFSSRVGDGICDCCDGSDEGVLDGDDDEEEESVKGWYRSCEITC